MPDPESTPAPTPEDPALAQTLRDLGPGRLVFGRFRLTRELGAGGMAVVWLAQDERLGLEVALKFLPGLVAADPEALHDLRREITRGLQLTHPGIVRVYDLHEGEGLAAIAMEYVAGSTLAEAKARQPERCFAVGEPLNSWLRTLCEVLSYVHEQAKVVHRDLKPRNLMLTPDGRLKVADFGIASALSESHSRLTQQPGTSGTPLYMSPQQAAGRRPTEADDVYALGAIIYELLTSKPPFFRGNLGLILHQAATETPPSMRDRREELGVTVGDAIPPAWEETVAACLAKEPSARPASAREVASRLQLAVPLDDQPTLETHAARAPAKAVVDDAAKRYPLWIAAGALAVFLLIAFGYALWPKPQTRESARPSATSTTPEPGAKSTPTGAVDPSTVVNHDARVIALRYEKIDPKEFQQQMSLLEQKKISVVTLEDFLAWRRDERSIPVRSCLITFDRGLAEVYTQALPVVGSFDYRFTVFVAVSSLDMPGYLTTAQARELIEYGAEIQNGTATYANLPPLDPPNLYHEIVDASLALEAKLDHRITAVAYPRGAYSDAVREMVVKAGFQAGFTTEGKVITFTTPPDLLGRYTIEPGHPADFEKALAELGPEE